MTMGNVFHIIGWALFGLIVGLIAASWCRASIR
jgi:hypothetical protein